MAIRKQIEWVTNEKGCHLVTSHKKDRQGYIHVNRSLNGKSKDWQLHRYVYTQKHGEIPKGMVIMHSCDEPSCINLDHLSIGTIKQNSQDMIKKGRGWTQKFKYPTPRPMNLKALAKERGISMRILADLTGIYNQRLYILEHGKGCASEIVEEKLSKVLNTPIKDLYKEE